MSKKFTRFSLFLTYFLFAGCMGSWVALTSNVPSSRLGSSYASPGGEYTVKVPFLLQPGARIQEGTDPPTQFVWFGDDFGTLYRILSRDNQTGEVTFEQLESGARIGESPFGPIREKEVVTTIRGQELRLLTLTEDGSPLVSRSRVDGKTVERALDLVEAVSIFIHGNRVYTVSAGVTLFSFGPSEAARSAQAKENLETFLAGLSLFDEPSIEVASSDDAEILEAADAAVTVAKNHGFQHDGSDSENGRVEVKPTDPRIPESDQSIDVGIRAFCEREIARAFEILRPHAEQGNVDAQVILAVLLWQGGDVPQDRDEALSWFRKAADQGDGEAQVFLGNSYSFGDGVKVDFNEAVKWYSKAAEAGFAGGQYNLAYAHTIGRGAVQDHAKAVELYTMAANQGHVWAQSNLGFMYYNGDGVKADNVQAYKWWLLASEEGDKPAKQALGEIRPSMTGGEIKEAERLANSFVPKLSPAEQKLAQRCRESKEP